MSCFKSHFYAYLNLIDSDNIFKSTPMKELCGGKDDRMTLHVGL
jgi:hypothetical protein